MNKTKIVVLRGLLVLVILSGGLFLIEFIVNKEGIRSRGFHCL